MPRWLLGIPGNEPIPASEEVGRVHDSAELRTWTYPHELTIVRDDGRVFVWNPASVAVDDGTEDSLAVAINNGGVGRFEFVSASMLASLPSLAQAVVNGITGGRSIVRSGAIDIGGSRKDDLLDVCYAVAPEKILDCYLGEDIPAIGSTTTTWPSSVGGVTLAHAGAAGPFNTITDALTGRRGIADHTGLADRSLVGNVGVPKAAIIAFRNHGQYAPGQVIPLSFAVSQYAMSTTLYGTRWDNSAVAGSPLHYRDNELGRAFGEDISVWYIELPTNVASNVNLGGYPGFNWSMCGEIYGMMPLSDVLTAAERNAMVPAWMAYYAARRKDYLLVDGNSIAYGYYQPAGGPLFRFPWHNQMAAPNVIRANGAHSGYTLAQVAAALPATLANLSLQGFRHCAYFLYEVRNSIAVDNWTGPQCMAAVDLLADTALASGFNRVIQSTCMPWGGISPAHEAARQSYNTLVRTTYSGHAQGLVDFAAMADFSNPAGPLFVADQVHLNLQGYRRFGSDVWLGMQQLP